jgi:5-methylcytosine-specific restriction endonuclease McrA
MTIGHPCSTRRGRKFREAYRNAQPLCEPCLRKGKIAQTDEVHHIVPVSKGGTDAWSNLESRSEDCHKRAHGARPRSAVDPKTGLPIGEHWWNS